MSYVQGLLPTEQEAAFEKNYFGKVLLINFISTWNSLPKHCIFADSAYSKLITGHATCTVLL